MEYILDIFILSVLIFLIIYLIYANSPKYWDKLEKASQIIFKHK